MKKVLITLLIVALAVPVFASIQNNRVAELLISRLGNVRNSALRARNTLNTARAKMLDINANYGSQIDAGDVTKLTSIFQDIVSASNALDALTINIDTAYPTIQE